MVYGNSIAKISAPLMSFEEFLLDLFLEFFLLHFYLISLSFSESLMDMTLMG